LIGVIATVVVAVAAATGVTFAVSNASGPDKSVNLDDPSSPNNMQGSGSGNVSYGTAP
jgi:hypothetical protein